MVERIRQDQAVRDQLGQRRNAGLVRDVARGEQQRGVLAVQIGQFAFEFDQRVMGARDIAGAAGAGADPGRGLDHRADHLGVLAHAEIVVRTPDHDVARAVRRVPQRVRKPARDAFQIGENPVAVLVVQPPEGGTEELAIVHCVTRVRTKVEQAEAGLRAFLERFQLGCRDRNRSACPQPACWWRGSMFHPGRSAKRILPSEKPDPSAAASPSVSTIGEAPSRSAQPATLLGDLLVAAEACDLLPACFAKASASARSDARKRRNPDQGDRPRSGQARLTHAAQELLHQVGSSDRGRFA